MNLRICVCIPTYDNPGTIAAVVESCLRETPYPVLIVDDGSKTPVSTLVPESGRVQIVRFERNQGKGAAIRAGIRHAVKEGFTHLVTMDGDGQHLSTEIAKLVEAAEQDPWAVVIGCRKLLGEHVPKSTRFGRAFSDFWVERESALRVADSQSGFRLYPLFHVQTVSFFCRHYDFEIEVLIRLAWRGVRFRDTLIDVVYPPPEARVSHFDKFRDNVRISLLNTVLMTMALFRLHLDPTAIGVALGVGVFIGCTPFFGLHAVIAGVVALVFRLNAGVLLLGTQISIPPLAPFLALISMQLGGGNGLVNWLRGSLVLGAALGITTGGLAFAIARTRRRRVNWNGRSRGGRFGNWFLGEVIRRLGLRAGHFCLRFIVPYFYLFAPKASRAVREYLRQVHGEVGFFHLRWLVLKHFYRFGTVLMDRRVPGLETKRRGFENIRETLDEGKGLLIVSAHVGAWDIAAGHMGYHGLKDPFHTIEFQADTGPKPMPILEIYRMLAAGNAIGMMADRPTENSCELVPFLGGLIPLDVTPFRIAAITKTPMLFSFGVKSGDREYSFQASPAEICGRAYYAWMKAFAAELESVVRKYPDQWFNFFPAWSSPPTAPAEINLTTRSAKLAVRTTGMSQSGG